MQSSDVVINDQILASDHNNLRADIISLGFISMTSAAGGLAQQDAVYISGNNTVDKANPTSSDSARFIGFYTDTAVGGSVSVRIQTTGLVTGFSGLTAGKYVYLHPSNSGKLTQDVGSIRSAKARIVQVGIATSTTDIIIDKQPPRRTV